MIGHISTCKGGWSLYQLPCRTLSMIDSRYETGYHHQNSRLLRWNSFEKMLEHFFQGKLLKIQGTLSGYFEENIFT